MGCASKTAMEILLVSKLRLCTPCPQDIRFTQNEDPLYAICLGWPGKELAVRSLGTRGKLYPDDILAVSMLGTEEPIEWMHTPEALTAKLPSVLPCDYAFTLKVQLQA